MRELVADCGRCAALCCVYTGFEASDDFAFGKAAGEVCRHLGRDGRCVVHAELRARGLAGCAAYDCHGAGPRATQLFARRPLRARTRHEVFFVLRELHELLWLVSGAAALCDGELRAELAAAAAALDEAAAGDARAVLAADLPAHRARVQALLRRVRAALTR